MILNFWYKNIIECTVTAIISTKGNVRLFLSECQSDRFLTNKIIQEYVYL